MLCAVNIHTVEALARTVYATCECIPMNDTLKDLVLTTWNEGRGCQGSTSFLNGNRNQANDRRRIS